MVIHSNRRPAEQHIRGYNDPHAFKVVSIVPGVDDGIISREDIIFRRREELWENVAEYFNFIPVTHRSYDRLGYILLLAYEMDR